jgi:nitroreductase
VDAALIDRLLDTIAHAPTGVNFRQLTFTVIQDRTVLQSLRENLMQSLANAAAAGRLSETVEKVANTILSARKEGRDVVFRDAPHLLLVSSPPDAPCAEQDVAISLSYFELAAQSAGLGTVWCGYIHRLLEILPECKPMFQIPNGHIYYAMLFGLPAVSYPRTVQRSGSATIRKVRSV